MVIERLERCQQVDRGGVVLYSLFGNWGKWNGRVELSWTGQFPPNALPELGRFRNRLVHFLRRVTQPVTVELSLPVHEFQGFIMNHSRDDTQLGVDRMEVRKFFFVCSQEVNLFESENPAPKKIR